MPTSLRCLGHRWDVHEAHLNLYRFSIRILIRRRLSVGVWTMWTSGRR